MIIPQNSLKVEFEQYQEEYEKKAIEVLRSGWYITGNELKCFENEFASYLGVKHCIGVANGLDSICIAIKLLGIGTGDEVIVQGNTFIASVIGITKSGATPVFVEPDEHYGIDSSKIEEKITEKTKAIMVVHLYGIPCDMEKIVDICKRHKLKLIEDCAQSHGAIINNKMTGTFGDVSCFSFYPTKNLGCFGDGGAIVTNDDELAKAAYIYRNYGSEKRYYNTVVGVNSRLDEIQAGLLRVKLTHLDEIKRIRNNLANLYLENITNPLISLPKIRSGGDCVWHQFVIRTDYRDELIEYLNEKNIGTIIHYPIPPHLAECYRNLGYKKGDLPITEKYANSVLSLPMYNGLTNEEVLYVCKAINEFKPV